jgi:hypothetical protein
MKLMCIFDWLITVKEFLTSKPDDPFNPGMLLLLFLKYIFFVTEVGAI